MCSMAYASPYNSAVLQQYLKTASNMNVDVEYSTLTCKWRIICERCGATLTFSDEGSDIEKMYKEQGILDDSIQQFVKKHRHEKVSKPITSYREDDELLIPYPKLSGIEAILEARPAPLKIKRIGRRFR